jgi:hypothetical protein
VEELSLKEEISRRHALDRNAREHVIKLDREGADPAAIDAGWQEIGRIDTDNTAWLKKLLDERGWPLISEVGEDAAAGVWMFAQHADADREFQMRALNAMEPHLETGEVAPWTYAYLMDRVLSGAGKPQLYGTQCHRDESGAFVCNPCEDPENLDARRAQVGLKPIAEYLEEMHKVYG